MTESGCLRSSGERGRPPAVGLCRCTAEFGVFSGSGRGGCGRGEPGGASSRGEGSVRPPSRSLCRQDSYGHRRVSHRAVGGPYGPYGSLPRTPPAPVRNRGPSGGGEERSRSYPPGVLRWPGLSAKRGQSTPARVRFHLFITIFLLKKINYQIYGCEKSV